MKKLLIIFLLLYPAIVSSSALTKRVIPAIRYQQRATHYQRWFGGVNGHWGKRKPYNGGAIEIRGRLVRIKGYGRLHGEWKYTVRYRLIYSNGTITLTGGWVVKSLTLIL